MTITYQGQEFEAVQCHVCGGWGWPDVEKHLAWHQRVSDYFSNNSRNAYLREERLAPEIKHKVKAGYTASPSRWDKVKFRGRPRRQRAQG